MKRYLLGCALSLYALSGAAMMEEGEAGEDWAASMEHQPPRHLPSTFTDASTGITYSYWENSPEKVWCTRGKITMNFTKSLLTTPDSLIFEVPKGFSPFYYPPSSKFPEGTVFPSKEVMGAFDETTEGPLTLYRLKNWHTPIAIQYDTGDTKVIYWQLGDFLLSQSEAASS